MHETDFSLRGRIVDTADLKSAGDIRIGSSPIVRTNLMEYNSREIRMGKKYSLGY